MAKKYYIDIETLDKFRNELMDHFIDMCGGNDYNKLNLLTIGDAIDAIYDKYAVIPDEDVVEVTRCKDCQHSNAYLTWQGKEYYHCTANDGVNVAAPVHFCGYGERKEQE